MQNEIRKKTTEIVHEIDRNKNASSSAHIALNSIREKNCYYMKADKGNKLVILDKEEYDDRMKKLIEDGPYESVGRDPLPKMIRNTNSLVKEVSEIFGKRLQRTLHIPNPNVAKLYGLPKIHKIGNKMRPIVSNVSTPSSKLAKWFVNEMNKLKPIRSFSVKIRFNLSTKSKT